MIKAILLGIIAILYFVVTGITFYEAKVFRDYFMVIAYVCYAISIFSFIFYELYEE